MDDEKLNRLYAVTFLTRTAGSPKPFALVRDRDHTGVSGTGTVAYGAEFEDGTVVIRWSGDRPSTVVWDNIETAEAVHGHGGSTRFVWLSENLEDLAGIEERADAAEAKLAAARELCHNALTRAATQDDVWQDIEDPTPIPGWVTMVRRAIGDE